MIEQLSFFQMQQHDLIFRLAELVFNMSITDVILMETKLSTISTSEVKVKLCNAFVF